MSEYSLILPTKLLRRITKACAVLLNETRIALNEEGIAIRAVDPLTRVLLTDPLAARID